MMSESYRRTIEKTTSFSRIVRYINSQRLNKLEGIIYVTIYLDLIMLLSILCNGAILYVVIYLMRLPLSLRKLTLATFVATLFVPIVVYLPQSIANSILGKTIYSLFIVRSLVKLRPFQRFLQTLITFYLISFITGGALLAAHYMLTVSKDSRTYPFLLYVENIYDMQISLILLLIGFPFTLWLTKKWLNKIRLDSFVENYTYKVTMTFNKHTYETQAYLDSGNHLVDPLTNRPVMIAEARFTRMFFSKEEWRAIYLAIQCKDEGMLPLHVKKHFVTIPYQTVGNQRYLIAFKPDKVKVEAKGERIETKEVLVGIELQQLSVDATYQCLLHPEIVLLHANQVV